MAKLTDTQRKCLHGVLTSVIGTYDDMRVMLWLYSNVNVDDVLTPTNLTANLDDVINWFDSRGKTDDLVDAVARYNPYSPELKKYLADYRLRESTSTSFRTASRFATVYGITAGQTRLLTVNDRIGEPTQRQTIRRRLEAWYADYGLRITFEDESGKNPHIQYMQLDAETAIELPHGLHRDMSRGQLEALLTRIYGPPQESEPTAVTFDPPLGVPGNRVVVMLRLERIHSIWIFALNTRV